MVLWGWQMHRSRRAARGRRNLLNSYSVRGYFNDRRIARDLTAGVVFDIFPVPVRVERPGSLNTAPMGRPPGFSGGWVFRSHREAQASAWSGDAATDPTIPGLSRVAELHFCFNIRPPGIHP